MIVLALDTTTRAGSIAVLDDDRVLAVRTGDATKGHAERLPQAIASLLREQQLHLRQVDVLAVAAGPGSFTGLRIGIATAQGLAFALDRKVVGVSVLDALAIVAHGEMPAGGIAPARGEAETRAARETDATGGRPDEPLLAAWMDAQRHEVFAELYRGGDTLVPIDGPVSEPPDRVLERWLHIGGGPRIRVAGDAIDRYRDLLVERLGSRLEIVEPLPPLAPIIGRLAVRETAAGRAVAPHAVRPIYVRRPDAELARDRRS